MRGLGAGSGQRCFIDFPVTDVRNGSKPDIIAIAKILSGMSRTSAYALQERDPEFAAAWTAALESPTSRREGDEAREGNAPRVRPPQGDMNCGLAAPMSRRLAQSARNDLFARLGAQPMSCRRPDKACRNAATRYRRRLRRGDREWRA